LKDFIGKEEDNPAATKTFEKDFGLAAEMWIRSAELSR
jgi:hypothetical protein